MNSLGGTVLEDLTAGLEEFNRDPDQFVAIVTGTGDRAFCAGGDLKEMASRAASRGQLPVAPRADLAGLSACEKVTIAAINGVAVSGGFELSLCCDIRIASPNATFGVFEVKRGILAAVAVNVLPRLIPIGAAMDLLLCGTMLSADDALRIGLIQEIVPLDQLVESALKRADMVAKNSQAAVWGTKQIVNYWRNAFLTEQQLFYQAISHRVLLLATCSRVHVLLPKSVNPLSATSGRTRMSLRKSRTTIPPTSQEVVPNVEVNMSIHSRWPQ